MSDFPAAILDTILGRLAILFLTGTAGDLTAARHAAHQMLASYAPETMDELRLAAEIISFSFHAMDTLSQSANPEMSLNQKLRLRGSAVNLSRESHKSQRKLDQLRKARRAMAEPAEVPAAQPEQVCPNIDKASASKNVTAVRNGSQSWTQGYQQRQMAQRITENLRKNNTKPHVATTGTDQTPALPALA